MANEEILRGELRRARAECERLEKENAELRLRLGDPGANAFQASHALSPIDLECVEPSPSVTAGSGPELKVSLFRSLFRGRDDVYAVRWEGRNGRTGYSPAGVREWNPRAPAVPGRKKVLRNLEQEPTCESSDFAQMWF